MTISLVIKLFVVLILVILAAALILSYVKLKDCSLQRMKRIIFQQFHWAIWTVPLTVVFAIAFLLLYYSASGNTASAIITLNYSEASNGQNSNQTRFNMSDIISNDVLELAIEKGALEGVTPDALKEALSVVPTVQGDSYLQEGYHISTEFEIQYNATSRTKHLNAYQLMDLLVDAYEQYYIEQYADNFDVLNMTFEPQTQFADMDYLDIVSYLEQKCYAIEDYMYVLASASPSFVSSKGNTFTSLAEKAQQIVDVQLDNNLRSYLLFNSVSKNAADYISRLNYENSLTEYERRKMLASYEIRNEAVQMYSEEMTRIVLVPTWDEAGDYYMGRTKVGIDALSMEAQEYSGWAASCTKTLESNNTIIRSMEQANSSGNNEVVDQMIAEICASLEEIAKVAKDTGREYSASRMNGCIFSAVRTDSVFKGFVYGSILALLFFIVLNFLAVVKRISMNIGWYLSEKK